MPSMRTAIRSRYSAANLPAGATLLGQTFSWTPTYDQAGSYNVTLTASDGQAQTSQTIAIAVANIDRPPVLADIDAKSIDPGNPLSFALSATDPDGDNLTYSATTLPSGATPNGSDLHLDAHVRPRGLLPGHLHRQRRHPDRLRDRDDHRGECGNRPDGARRDPMRAGPRCYPGGLEQPGDSPDHRCRQRCGCWLRRDPGQ